MKQLYNGSVLHGLQVALSRFVCFTAICFSRKKCRYRKNNEDVGRQVKYLRLMEELFYVIKKGTVYILQEESCVTYNTAYLDW